MTALEKDDTLKEGLRVLLNSDFPVPLLERKLEALSKTDGEDWAILWDISQSKGRDRWVWLTEFAESD